MEAACERFVAGDRHALEIIVSEVAARSGFPQPRVSAPCTVALVELLVKEGGRLRQSSGSAMPAPSLDALYALGILSVISTSRTMEGYDARRILIGQGLQRCREMYLDVYFYARGNARFHVARFLKRLVLLYGCLPEDLIVMEGSLEMYKSFYPGPKAKTPPPETAASPAVAGPQASPVRGGTEVINLAAGGQDSASRGRRGQTDARAAAASPSPLPPVPRDAPAAASSSTAIQNRSSQVQPIPGVSFDLPARVTRRSRDLPKKAVNLPFAVNPLYENASNHSLYVATALDGTANADPTIAAAAPPALPEPTAPEVAITAQFPTPVLLFSAYYGLGCVPVLPTVSDLARLDGWRKAQREEVPPQPREPKGLSVPLSRYVLTGRVPGSRHNKASHKLVEVTTTPGVTDDDPRRFQIRNERNYAGGDEAAAHYQRACLKSSVLRQYVEHGRLLSWGASAKGALGPLHQRRASSSNSASGSSVGHTAVSAARSASSARTRGRPLPRREQHSAPPTPLTSTVIAPPEPHSGEPEASMAALLPVTTVAHATGPGAYVYLPLPVHTTARVAAIGCGLSVTYVVTLSGALFSCGRGEHGQLGIGERSLRYAEPGTSRLHRVLLKDSERVTRVAAGSVCAVALAGERGLYCWGHNVYGQCLKLPDASRVLTPVRLKTSKYKVLDICFGQFFGVLLFDDGMMGTWGIASMLGCAVNDKALEESLAPDHCKCARQVVHLDLGPACTIAAVRAGPWHALAISKLGEVYTWGVGKNGRLGHGTDAAEVKPKLVEELQHSFVVDASCASGHSAVLTSTGSVYVFGENAEGQLGQRGRSPRRLPVMLPLPGKAVAVACGREHTCVLLEDGDVVACGSIRTAGVGLGYGGRLCAPVRILTNYISLTLQCGHFHSLAGVTHRRTALMMVGHSTIDEVTRISSVVVRNGVRCAASGIGFLVVLSENNTLVAIGRGERGQLGVGDFMRPRDKDDVTVTQKFTPVQLPESVVVQHLRCGPDYVVAIDQDGLLYGWGSNEHQKLGQPAGVECVYAPVRLTGYGPEPAVQVACGGSFLLALTAEGEVFARGEAAYCGIGKSTTTATVAGGARECVETPTRVTALHDVVAIAAGRRHAVAMTSSCTVFAWGVGVLGSDRGGAALTTVAATPVRVAVSLSVRAVGCGPNNSFIITEDGELWVWGVNRFGECGATSGHDGSVRTGGAAGAQADTSLSADASTATSVIATPVLVARQVRDAAFTAQFGVAVFEDGQVRVSGRVRQGGRRYVLPSFHSNPQPAFSIDVNEPMRQRRHSEESLFSSGHSRGEGAGTGSSAATATASGHGRPGVTTIGERSENGEATDVESEEAEEESSDTDNDEHIAASPVSESTSLPPSSKRTSSSSAHRLPPNGAGQREGAKETTSSSATEAVAATSVAAAPVAAAAAAASTSTSDKPHPPTSSCLPSVRPLSGQHRTVAAAAPPAEVRAPRLAFMPAQQLGSDAAVSLGGVPAPTPTAGAAERDGDGRRSPVVAVHVGRSFPEADDGSPLQAPLPTPDNGGSRREKKRRTTPVPALSPTPPAQPRHPDGSPLPERVARQPPSARAPTRSRSRSKGKRSKSRQTSPVPDAPLSADTPTANAKTGPASAAAVSTRIFGLRCFPGWEQICTVMEKGRPSAAEVRMAQVGLQAMLHQQHGDDDLCKAKET